jgi:hypothetical protein
LFIDWSSRNGRAPAAPAKDSIWIGELTKSESAHETYCRTRAEATEHVRERLRAHVEAARRVLVGFDFPYGYPGGFARSLGLNSSAPWRAIWDLLDQEISDDNANVSNRFVVASALNQRIGGGPGPFWGCPKNAVTEQLSMKKHGLFTFPYTASAASLERLRRTEKAIGLVKGIGQVQETWKLAGAGSVGSQALVGIPRVRQLRFDPDLEKVSSVWPFQTDFTSTPVPEKGPWVLHAEIWPGIVPSAEVVAEKELTNAIHDQAQVRLMCRWAEYHDEQGTLGAWFDATALPDAERRAAVQEEGWILGCPA